MNCRAIAKVAVLFIVIPPVSAREATPNFYLPPSATDKKDEPDKPTEVRRNAAEATPASKQAVAKKRNSPPFKQQSTAEWKTSVIQGLNLRKRQITPEGNFDPPMDPYGLARYFNQRWDFTSFLITAEEELKFRLDAARTRTTRLARAFSALASEVEIRQRNLSSSALAAYLLSRDQHSWNPVQGRSMTEAQMLAVKATMRQDIKAMQTALTDYEALRNSVNASAEEVAALEKNGLKALEPAEGATGSAPTIPTAELAKRQTRDVLEERLVSVEALKATLAAESMSAAGDRRKSIASFAPPPPIGGRPERSGTTLPEVPSADVMKAQPKGESLKAPEKTALVIPAQINAPVHVVRKGVVMYAGPFRGYGSMVIVEHEEGLFSVYSHLATIQVKEREPVVAGAILGRAGVPPELGRSGIHFQVRHGKQALRPDDWLGVGQAEKLLTRN